jgi:hypothetical protein
MASERFQKKSFVAVQQVALFDGQARASALGQKRS